MMKAFALLLALASFAVSLALGPANAQKTVTVNVGVKSNGANAGACLAQCRAERRAASLPNNFRGICLKK
jgi:hypothetical protein